jgi:hypothetical protein
MAAKARRERKNRQFEVGENYSISPKRIGSSLRFLYAFAAKKSLVLA